MWGRRLGYAFAAGRCIRSAALQLDRKACIVRRLISKGERGQRGGRGLDLVLRQFKAVEAAARHEEYLIAAHEAGGTKFAAEFPLFAQDARLGIAAAVAGSGEVRANKRQ